MSLTSQLDKKTSPVRQFFSKYEDKQGIKECLAELQSTKQTKKPAYKPASQPVWGLIGTATDYLIRYVANNNRLEFDQTIACQARSVIESMPRSLQYAFNTTIETADVLYEIGRAHLDGRSPDEAAVYSATALSLLDNAYRSRSGRMFPAYFDEHIAYDGRLDSYPGDYGLLEKLAMLKFYNYFCSELSGKDYAQDILEILNIFASARSSFGDEFSETTFTVFNLALANDHLVCGADIDCVITQNKMNILTDIKTTIHSLPISALRQLIGYALLHDEEKDQFTVDEIGIYYSRSGSFRHIPVRTIIRKCLPSFKTVEAAKKAFIYEAGNCPATAMAKQIHKAK